MGFKSILKHIAKGGQQALPIAAAFGVPGASTVQIAVDTIIGDHARPNEDASKLLAATTDAMDERISQLEQTVISQANAIAALQSQLASKHSNG